MMADGSCEMAEGHTAVGLLNTIEALRPYRPVTRGTLGQ